MIIPKLIVEHTDCQEIIVKEKALTGAEKIRADFQLTLKGNANGYFDPQLVDALDLLSRSRSDFPPSNNMGGNLPSPPLSIPHGEKSGVNVAPQKTKIDWLAFTSSAELEALKVLLGVIWPDVAFATNSHGMPGYPDSCAIRVDGVQFGQIGFGAKHGRNFVSLTGTACKTLSNDLVDLFYEALSLPELDVSLSRLDLCFDVFGGNLTVDHAHWRYGQGAFNRRNGGVDPELKMVGTTKGGRNLGRTMYVGKRGGHCMARIYEKGLEVYAKMPEDQRLLCEIREHEIKADPFGNVPKEFHADDWLRLEVEYRRQGKELPLPLEMMIARDDYFAGAYPYFADALGYADEQGVRPKGMKEDFDVDLLAMISNAKRSYGSLVHSLTELGFTSDDVVQYLTTGRNNDKLVRSGLFAKIRSKLDTYDQDAVAFDPNGEIPGIELS